MFIVYVCGLRLTTRLPALGHVSSGGFSWFGFSLQLEFAV